MVLCDYSKLMLFLLLAFMRLLCQTLKLSNHKNVFIEVVLVERYKYEGLAGLAFL